MTPDVLGYRSALEILKFVAANEGARNWYGITCTALRGTN